MPRPRLESWEDLAERLTRHDVREAKDGAAWSPAIYSPGATRGSEGVEAITALVVDVDHDAQAVLDRLPKLLAGVAHVVYSTHSHTIDEPRFRVVVQLAEPIAAADWPEAWARAAALFGGAVDPAAKDLARIYYLPSARPGAPKFKRVKAGAPLDWRTLPPATSRPTSARTSRDFAPNSLLAELPRASRALGLLDDSRADDYHTWLGVGMALAELGDVGLPMWDHWSQASPKWQPGVCAEKWATFDRTDGNRITLGSLYHWAREDSGEDVAAGGKIIHQGRVLGEASAIAGDTDRLAALEARVADLEALRKENEDLRALNANLEARLDRMAAERMHAERELQTVYECIKNPDVREVWPTALVLLKTLDEKRDQADPLGWVQVYSEEVCEAAGVSRTSIYTHGGKLEKIGLVDRQNREDTRETGRRYKTYLTYYRPKGRRLELLEQLASYRKPADAPRWGVYERCPEHPKADVIVETTYQTRRVCGECGKQIGDVDTQTRIRVVEGEDWQRELGMDVAVAEPCKETEHGRRAPDLDEPCSETDTYPDTGVQTLNTVDQDEGAVVDVDRVKRLNTVRACALDGCQNVAKAGSRYCEKHDYITAILRNQAGPPAQWGHDAGGGS